MATKDAATEAAKLDGFQGDGWAYAVTLRDGQVFRLCDRDRPDIVWSRIKAAGKNEVTFSGRSEPGGKVDGFGILFAEDVRSIRNFGPSVVGAGSVEARILKLEEITFGPEGLVESVNEIQAELDEEDEEGLEEPGAPPAAELAAIAQPGVEEEEEAPAPSP